MYVLAQVIDKLVTFYEWLVIIYCLLSWFPIREGGILSDIASVIASLVEPYLSLFRRIIPPLGGIDFSPTIAIIALFAIENILFRILLY